MCWSPANSSKSVQYYRDKGIGFCQKQFCLSWNVCKAYTKGSGVQFIKLDLKQSNGNPPPKSLENSQYGKMKENPVNAQLFWLQEIRKKWRIPWLSVLSVQRSVIYFRWSPLVDLRGMFWVRTELNWRGCKPTHVLCTCAKHGIPHGLQTLDFYAPNVTPGTECDFGAQFTQEVEHIGTCTPKLWNTLWPVGVFTQIASSIKEFACQFAHKWMGPNLSKSCFCPSGGPAVQMESEWRAANWPIEAKMLPVSRLLWGQSPHPASGSQGLEFARREQYSVNAGASGGVCVDVCVCLSWAIVAVWLCLWFLFHVEQKMLIFWWKFGLCVIFVLCFLWENIKYHYFWNFGLAQWQAYVCVQQHQMQSFLNAGHCCQISYLVFQWGMYNQLRKQNWHNSFVTKFYSSLFIIFCFKNMLVSLQQNLKICYPWTVQVGHFSSH